MLRVTVCLATFVAQVSRSSLTLQANAGSMSCNPHINGCGTSRPRQGPSSATACMHGHEEGAEHVVQVHARHAWHGSDPLMPSRKQATGATPTSSPLLRHGAPGGEGGWDTARSSMEGDADFLKHSTRHDGSNGSLLGWGAWHRHRVVCVPLCTADDEQDILPRKSITCCPQSR